LGYARCMTSFTLGMMFTLLDHTDWNSVAMKL